MRHIGARTARRLLATPGPVSRLWNGPSALEGLGLRSAPVVAEALRQGQNGFQRSRELATLRDDVPLDLADESLAYGGIDADATRALCDRLGFDRLRDRILDFAAKD